jgi:hypothetical protein
VFAKVAVTFGEDVEGVGGKAGMRVKLVAGASGGGRSAIPALNVAAVLAFVAGGIQPAIRGPDLAPEDRWNRGRPKTRKNLTGTEFAALTGRAPLAK